jgi:hypothetical protein
MICGLVFFVGYRILKTAPISIGASLIEIKIIRRGSGKNDHMEKGLK